MSFGSPYFTLPDFTYYRAKSLKEALELLKEKKGSARVMAGGVGLVALMKERLVSPSFVIDIKGIPELKGVEVQDGFIRIGACTTLEELSENKYVKDYMNALHEAAREAADIAIRARATIGGNVCEAIPWVDMPAPLIALDAEVEIQSLKGSRLISVESFLKGMLEVDIAEEEIVTGFRIPLKGRRSIFRKFNSGSEFSLASIAVSISDEDVRVVYGSVSPKPLRCPQVEEIIKSEGLSEAVIRKAIGVAGSSVECMDDVLSSSEYRKNIVEFLTASVLRELRK
jgi:CO/xanthine dehydrogenase FAD-binding subunit